MNDEPSLVVVAPDVWQVRAPSLRLPAGVRMPIASTVVRLADRSLLVYSPGPLQEAELAAIDAIGDVAHVVAPNLWHHLFLREAAARYPRATVHGAPGLTLKRSELPIHRDLATADSAFGDTIDVLVIDGAPQISEVVLFHRPSGTLVCADLAFNIRNPESFMSSVLFSMTGVHKKLAQSRVWGFAVKDRAATRASIDALVTWNVRRLSPVHGDAVEIDNATLASLMTRAYGGSPRPARAADT